MEAEYCGLQVNFFNFGPENNFYLIHLTPFNEFYQAFFNLIYYKVSDDSYKDYNCIKLSDTKYLEINGKKWLYIKDRVLERGQIYRSLDRTQYLHLGSIAEIKREANFVGDLYDRNFPVPAVFDQGEIDGAGYYTEKSVGRISLGELFRKEYDLYGKVSKKAFTNFCDMAGQFLEAQLNLRNRIKDGDELRKGVHVSKVLEENPDIKDKLLICIGRIKTELRHLPLVLTHGDFSPRNIFSNGVIDFEHRFIANVGYDVLTGATIQRFWNFKGPNGKTQLEFDLSSDQIADYFDKLNIVAEMYGIDGFSEFTDKFVLLKAIWSLAYEKQFARQIGNNLKWNFRKNILIYCMDQYLNGKPIDTSSFGNLDKGL